MENTIQSKLSDLQHYLSGGDYSLVLRRFTDFIIDTESPQLFRECLKVHDLFEQESKSENFKKFSTSVVELLPKIEDSLKQLLPADNALLSISNLGKTYRFGNFKIEGVDTTLKKGEIVGLVGENGNGKTTLLRMIGGELKPSSGELNYHYSKQKPGTYPHRGEIVFVPQRIPKWYGSLMDNLKFTNSFYGRLGEENTLWAEIMIARLGLRKFKHLNWNRISSGYKTRFELARVLLQKPHVLLLDEPLANLDIFAQQTVLQDLKHRAMSLRSPFGIVLSSQQLYEVEKISDKVIFLKNGVPKYQSFRGEEAQVSTKTVFEIECESRIELESALASIKPEKLTFNGGVFIVSFSQGVTMQQLLGVLSKSQLRVLAIRDISLSSRRFFEE